MKTRSATPSIASCPNSSANRVTVIFGPSRHHCEAMAAHLGFKRGSLNLFHDAGGQTIRFIVEPERLLELPQDSILFDAFAGCFTHALARRFAERLGHFNQYCFEPEDVHEPAS